MLRPPTPWLLAPLAALPVLAGCAEPEPDDRVNVLLLTVDTLRADRVGCYGNDRALTPHLDALAAEGVRFARSYSHAPFTAPSHASLLTSLATPSHGVLAWAEELAPEAVTMPDRFGAEGYRTAAFYNNPGLVTSDITRGFDHSERFFLETADTTLDAFFEWLDDGRGAFCVWLHFWDVHRPYAWRDWRPEWLREHMGVREPGFLSYGETLFSEPEPPTTVAVGRDEGHYNLNPQKRANPQYVGKQRRLLEDGDFEYIVDRYDAGVRFADRGLGRLVEGLERRGLFENTVLVVTSDHGESLTERESCYFSHDPFLFEETLKVPLVIRFPGGRYGGAVVDALARGVDVLPTLYDVARIAPGGDEQGSSLIGRIEGTDTTEYLLWAQTQTVNAKERRAKAEPGTWLEHRVAVSDGRRKLVHDLGADRFQFFDLEADPAERHDRFEDPAAQPEVERLMKAYRALEAGLPKAGDTVRELDPAMLDVLEQTGYAGD